MNRMDGVIVRADGLEERDLDGERLVWRDGRLYRLDTVGAVVWDCLAQPTARAELAADLAAGFGVEVERIRAGLDRLLAELRHRGLLAGSEPPPEESVPDTVGETPARGPGAVPAARSFDAHEWVWRSPRLVALDFEFGVRTDAAEVAEYLAPRLRAFTAAGVPSRWYSVSRQGDRWTLHLNDIGVASARTLDVIVRFVLWHINMEVMRLARRHVLVHAAAAALDGGAVVMPGPMNAGKTTLVAGLVRDGFGYLTDELAAIRLTGDGVVDPYPRPLNVGRGSFSVLADLEPPDASISPILWHVDPCSIRPGAVAGPAVLRWVVVPAYEPGVRARMTPLSRAEALEALHHHAMGRGRPSAAAFHALVDALDGVRCARLVAGDLPSAVAAVRDWVGGSPST